MEIFIKKRHPETPKEGWNFCRLKGLEGIDEDIAGDGAYLRWNGKYWDGVSLLKKYHPNDIAYWLEEIEVESVKFKTEES